MRRIGKLDTSDLPKFFSLPLFIMAQLSANWYEDNQTNVFNGVTIFGISWDFSYGQIHSNIGMDHYEEIIGFAPQS